MTTGTTNTDQSQKPTTAPGEKPGDKVVRYDRYIERQLNKTRTHAKLVDLASGLMTLAAGILGFLFLMAVVDHWVVGLSGWARLAALVVLLGGIAYYFLARVLPLLARRINPLYAAHAIEQSKPSLKNSLINFLLFRSNRSAVGDVVYHAIEQRAANDLSQVPVDSAVDRSRLIKIGYVLAGVVLVSCLYVIISPKDPFKTVARVLAPWREIARPARALIEDIQPGDTNVFHGQVVRVSATVRGVGEDDPVRLYYSSDDEQTVDRAVAMHAVESGVGRYECRLPPGEQGIGQNLTYRIEAWDAVSKSYRVTVRPGPAISVESIEYDYPRYTGRPNRLVKGQGDIKALEGTRVTIHARANHPIETARVDFDGDERNSLHRMQVDEQKAQVRFILVREGDHPTPASYQLRFQTPEGLANQQPIEHSIEVIPDLPPEVEILTPEQRDIEVPQDGSQVIEVRAVDPDFALSRLSLKMEHSKDRDVQKDRDVSEVVLLDRLSGQTGQVDLSHDFVPGKLGLVEGDVVTYWAHAADNKTSPRGEPNTSRTDQYRIRIVAPQRPPRDGSKSPDEGGGAEQPSEDQQGQEGQDRKDGADGQAGSDAKGQDPQAGQQPQGAGDGKPREEDGQKGDAGSDQPRQGQAQQDDQQSGEGQPGQEGAGGNQSGTPQRRERPLDAEGTEDGEVIEAVNEHIRQREQQQDGAGGSDGAAVGDPSKDAGNQQPRDGQDQGRQERGEAPRDNEPGQRQQGNGEGRSQKAPSQDGPSQKNGDASDENRRTATGQGEEQQSNRDEPNGQGGQEKAPSEDKPGGRKQAGPEPGQKDESKDQGEPGGGAKPDKRQTQRPDGKTGETKGSGADRDERRSSPNDPQDQDKNSSRGGQADRKSPDRRPSGGDSQKGDPQANQSAKPAGGGQQPDGQDTRDADGQGADGQGADGQGADGQGADGQGANGQGANGQGNDKDTDPGKPGDQISKSPSQSNTDKKTDGAAPDKQPKGAAEPSGSKNDKRAQPEEGAKGQPQNGQPTEGDGRQQQDARGGQSGQQSQGGGAPGDRQPSSPKPPPEQLGGDEANLKYSRKATDLALQHLKDQQDNPDQNLLDKLGWSKEDMKRFVDRWERMKQSAAAPDQKGRQAKRQLDETLRSLGLRPGRDRLRQGGAGGDGKRGLRDAGGRSRPPREFLDKYKAYLEGTARARKE